MTFVSNQFRALLVAALVYIVLPAAHAVVVVTPPSELLTFKYDFNDVALPLSTATASGYGLGNVGLSSNIALSMTTALGKIAPTASVAVTGAVATQNYNGEGHVIATNGVAKTLGNTDAGALTLRMDTFIVNNNFGLVQNTSTAAATGGVKSDFFTMKFSNFFVTSISFDYEIFPSASCQKGNLNCVSDFKLYSDLSPAPADLNSPTAYSTALWWTAVHSTATMDAQSMGMSGVINTFGAKSLTFADWPAEIGIDNVVITGCVTAVNGQCGPSKVPEPTTLALLGLGLFGFAAVRRRKQAAR